MTPSRIADGLRPASVLLASIVVLGAATTLEAAPLPEPLTLEASLSLADTPHPDLSTVEAENASRRADQLAVEALTGLPARFAEDDAADRMLLLHARQHRRTKILRCYLGVLLADLTAARDNEAMAIAYVRMDRARERHTLGQLSDVALAEYVSTYRSALSQRTAAEAQQRIRRSRLSLALNRPGELPSVLLAPRLPGNQAERPSLESLESRALEHNTRLQALRLRRQAAQQRLDAARRATESAGGDEAGADGTPSRSAVLRAAVARHEAELARLESKLDEIELRVRQRILDAWLELANLDIARQDAADYADYRDLRVDLNRALYEQEVRADLGDAMTKSSEARLRTAETEFAIARTWARIGLLTGRMPEDMSADILGAPE